MPDDVPSADDEPIARPTVVGKSAPAGRKFPCAKCGARLDFDPKSRQLRCGYCDYTQVIEPGGEVAELDLLAQLARHSNVNTLIAGRSTEVRCPGCGAVVLLEDKVVTENCPYCHTHLDNQPEAAKEMIDPESVLPFAVNNRDALIKFDEWLHALWFAPSELRKLANLGQLNGVYVPFWTYDSMTYSWYQGQRGDNYTVTVDYVDRDAQGNSVSRTRTETRIRWHAVSGQVDHFFDDVLIRASKSLPEHLLAKFADWDLPNLEGFRPEFLAGFLTERYAVALDEGLVEAKAIMEAAIREMCRQDIGGDHQRVENVETKHVGMTFKHVLLPIWVASYRYRDKLFQILVNGRTGQIAGERPWSWWKITRLVLLVVSVVGVVAALASGVGR